MLLKLCGVVVQLIARWIRNRTVLGSNPMAGTSVTAFCVIPLSREFTHTCSGSIQPSHPSVGRQKMRSSAALRQQLTRSLGPLALGQGTCRVSWRWAEGYRNGRSASNPMGSAEEPNGCCCCCLLLQYPDLCIIVHVLGPQQACFSSDFCIKRFLEDDEIMPELLLVFQMLFCQVLSKLNICSVVLLRDL